VIEASPGFQQDREGAPGSQLADAGGFQTPTPALVGALEAVVTPDSPTAFVSSAAQHYVHVGELVAVVTLASLCRFTAGTPAVRRWGRGVDAAAASAPLRLGR